MALIKNVDYKYTTKAARCGILAHLVDSNAPYTNLYMYDAKKEYWYPVCRRHVLVAMRIVVGSRCR